MVVQAEPFVGYPGEKQAPGFAAIIASIRHNETLPTAYIASGEAFLTNCLMGVMPLTHLNSPPSDAGRPYPVRCHRQDSYEKVVQTETTFRL